MRNFDHFHPAKTFIIVSRNSIRYHIFIIWNTILADAINLDSYEVSYKIKLKIRNRTKGFDSYLPNLEQCPSNWSVLVQACTLHPCSGMTWTNDKSCTR